MLSATSAVGTNLCVLQRYLSIDGGRFGWAWEDELHSSSFSGQEEATVASSYMNNPQT